MTCTDPRAARLPFEDEDPDPSAFRGHLEACPDCRDFDAAVRAATAGDSGGPHPAADALVSYDEDPASLAPRVRAWIASHLGSCAACADLLRAVPAQGGPAPRRPWLRPWPLAAAAGWAAALLVALAPLVLRPEPAADPVLSAFDVVLSTPRGEDAPAVPPGAQVLRLHLLLAAEVPTGGVLDLRLADAGGRTVFERRVPVQERDERDWPVLTLDRRALPPGPLTLHVRTPSGESSAFALRLP